MDTTMQNATKKKVPSTSLDQQLKHYKAEEGMSLTVKVAHFLDWAATAGPGQYVPYNVILKTINGYARLPQLDSKEVEVVRRNMSRVRALLQKTYGRELDSQPGVGVRATYSDADTLTVALPKKLSRFRAAKDSLKTTADLIDTRNIPNTPELKPWKDWMNRSVTDVLKLVGSEDFEQKCLPPGSSDPKNPQ